MLWVCKQTRGFGVTVTAEHSQQHNQIGRPPGSLSQLLFTKDLCRKNQLNGVQGAEGTKSWRKHAGGAEGTEEQGRVQFSKVTMRFIYLFQYYTTFGSISRPSFFMTAPTFRDEVLRSLRKPSLCHPFRQCSYIPFGSCHHPALTLDCSPENKANTPKVKI